MNELQSHARATPQAEGGTALRRLWKWWRPGGTDERYLADATDVADLERRMRILERTSDGPIFQTFNH